MAKTRVLFIARYLQPVNQAKITALAKESHIDLIHGVPEFWEDSFNRYDLIKEADLPYTVNPYRPQFLRKGDIHRFFYRPISLQLSSLKPDIIHLEEEPDSLIALQTVLARRLMRPQAKLVVFSWQNMVRRRRLLARLILKMVLSQTDFLIGGNSEVLEVLQKEGFKGPGRHLPQLGLDPRYFFPQRADNLRQKFGFSHFTVGYIGRLIAAKGVDLLIDAAAQLKDIELVFLGKGQEEPNLRGAASSIIPDRVHFIPPVPHEEVGKYLNTFDVLVLPSRTTPNWKEQFGHVLIEAMACGIPVIGSDSGAIPEVVGEAGLIFPENDVVGLAAAIKLLQDDPVLRSTLAQKGMERVQNHFTHQKIAQETVEIYKKIAGFHV